jgi:putative tryptophan/tyrosine transport system substrate-binding protein
VEAHGARGRANGLQADAVEMDRRVAVFVDKILKGAQPGDLETTEQPTRFELVVTLKIAKALDILINR